MLAVNIHNFDMEEAKKILVGVTAEPWIVATDQEVEADYEHGDKLVGGYTGRDTYDQELGVYHPKDTKRQVGEGENEFVDDYELISVIRPEQEADAKFIANVRRMYPAALSEIDRLTRRNEANRNLIALAYDLLQEQMKLIVSVKNLNNDLMGHCNALRSRAQKAELRVKELENSTDIHKG